ncbi:MAG: PAS domain S-box protein [Candidatus Latescibacteria bacterium]|nr:PAS domain S-box protein [Candidatus Latescibacterota bacterium]
MMNVQDEYRDQILTALEEAASHYKAILETTVDAIITIDNQGIVQTFNSAAEKIFSYRAEEVIGNNIKMLMPAPYRSEHDGYISRYLKTGVPKIIGIGRQVTGRRKDGTEFPMDLAVSEVPLKDKQVFTGIVRDITEHKRLEEQLVQSAKLAAVGKLVSGIAHEVNNPVSIIKMHIAGLMQDAESQKLPKDLMEVLRVIQRQNNKVSQIMAGLLAFSRQGSFSPEWTDVNQPMHAAARLVENTLQNQGIVYQAELADSLPKVFLDPVRIEQVLVNLFNNAIDTMSGGGVLTVSTALETDETHRDWVIIRVGDTGEGIDEEHIDQLFDPFFTTKEVGEGTGLGLSVSYGLIQEHGGRIEVSSQRDKGSEFQIYLPVTE